MALGTPEQMDSFVLGGYQLQVAAPEEMRWGLKTAYRFFFFKLGKPVVQKGRVTLKPVSLSFRYHGPDAIAIARYIERMQSKQVPCNLSWLGQFSYRGFITDSDFSATQREVTGTIEYQPTEDLLTTAQENALGAKFAVSTALDAAAQAQAATEAIADGEVATKGLAEHLQDLKAMVGDELKPLNDFREAADAALTSVKDSIQTFGDIASMPYQTASALVETIYGAVAQIPAAAAEAQAKILAPLYPVLDATAQYVAEALGQTMLVAMDDTEVALLNLANAVQPAGVEYTAEDGDTLEFVAGAFGVSLGAVLAVNPGLRAGALSPGQTIKIPPNG